MQVTSPIFVRGLSRSGGTLSVTLLDCHSEISMSYELYPNLLDIDANVEFIELAKKIMKASEKEIQRLAPTKKFGTFALRCKRSGISIKDFADQLINFSKRNLKLDNVEGQLTFVEMCCRLKMEREGKRRWGAKCNSSYDDYLKAWPDAKFINIVRDGRDVLASQLNTGNFKKSTDEIAYGWVNTHKTFINFKNMNRYAALIVHYEKLVLDPENQLKRICNFLGLSFEKAMLNHSKKELTIHSANHLSGRQIKEKINNKSIGRWKFDLDQNTLEKFEKIASPMLAEFGYEV